MLIIQYPVGNPTSSLPNRYNKLGGNASQLSMPTAVQASHVPKQYKKKDRRMPTKRFNSAASSGDELSGNDTEGELDPTEFDQPPELSLSLPQSIEGVYDLVKSPETVETSSNTNNNNKTEPVTYDSVKVETSDELLLGSNLTKSVCINESLYDLVGRINAGEGETILGEKSDMTASTELYEPIGNNESNSVVATKLPIRSQPLPQAPPSTEPKQLYDVIQEPGMGGVMYEDIDRQNELKEAESSDEETVPLPPRLVPTGKPPPIPPRQGEEYVTSNEVQQETYNNVPTLPSKALLQEDQEMYDNAPSLPLKGLPHKEQTTPPNLAYNSISMPSPHEDQEMYDNAPSLPLKQSPPKLPQRSPRSPVPTPRTRKSSKSSNASCDIKPVMEDEIYDDIVRVESNGSLNGERKLEVLQVLSTQIVCLPVVMI